MTYIGVESKDIASFYSRHNNGCGQAAVACVLNFHCKLPPGLDVDDIYSKYPPNVMWGAFGSSPNLIEQMCKGYGLNTYRYCNNEQQGPTQLKNDIAARKPTIVMLDLGKLGQSWNTYHWAVAYGYDQQSIYLANMGRVGYKEDWGSFMEAWHCWVLNSPFPPDITAGDCHWAGIVAN